MAVADIVLIRTQVLEKLIASPRAARYTDAIGEGKDYAVKQEITDNILIIDFTNCNDIIGTPGHPFRSSFMIPSSPLVSGDFIPAHTGAHGDVQVSLSGVYDFSVPAKSRDEILAMRGNPTLYGGASRHHYIEDSVCHHAGEFAKVWYPSLAKTALCQSPQAYEDVLIYGTIHLCEKIDIADEFYDKNLRLYQYCRQMVKGGAEFIPSQQQLEAAIRKAG